MEKKASSTGSVYEVRLHGILPPRVLDSLCTELEMRADTVLCGVIQDQAALHGLLAQLSDLGLELIDICQTWRRGDERLTRPDMNSKEAREVVDR